MPGAIILLNGAPSSGKSTLASRLQTSLQTPAWHYSIDHLRAAHVLPQARIDSGEFPWASMREQFFDGFHRSIRAFAEAGNLLIVEHIIETRAWLNRLLLLLEGFDVFLVGVHCPLEELERRELERGDRRVGSAKEDFDTIHSFVSYDYECHSTKSHEASPAGVIQAWQARTRPSAFEQMLAQLRGGDSAA